MSLVLVSPSTVSWFQVRAAAGRRRPARTAGSTAASVRMIESIVAIPGWIMPTPLAQPLIVTERTANPSTSGRAISVLASFVRESVVRRATATASKP